MECGRCMLCGSWWGKGGARRDGKWERREDGAVVPGADPIAIVQHIPARELQVGEIQLCSCCSQP